MQAMQVNIKNMMAMAYRAILAAIAAMNTLMRPLTGEERKLVLEVTTVGPLTKKTGSLNSNLHTESLQTLASKTMLKRIPHQEFGSLDRLLPCPRRETLPPASSQILPEDTNEILIYGLIGMGLAS